MDEQKLTELLQKLSTPEPSAAQEDKAFSAAMQAFEAAQNKNQHSTQGITEPHRLTLKSAYWLSNLRRLTMKKSQFVGGTALALVLAVGISSVFVGQDYKHVTELTAVQPSTPPHVVEEVAQGAGATQQKTDVTVAEAEITHEADAVSSHLIAQPATNAPLPAAPSEPLAMLNAAPPVAMEKAKPMRQEMEIAGMVAQDRAAAPVSNFMVAEKKEAAVGGVVRHMIVAPQPAPDVLIMPREEGNDKFEELKDSPLKLVKEEPVSTFSIDVDTSSYSFLRRSLNQGQLPDPGTVRVEELINYFDYNYPLPERKSEPFQPTIAVYPTPWNANTQLVHIGIKGYDVPAKDKPRANLVFLIDTSGSMQSQDKLPLLVTGFKMMVENLQPEDSVSIVTYAGSAGTVLEPTKVSEKSKILVALDNLYAGGSTAGAAGIQQAYALAEEKFDKQGINRVILATDGDFNVGISDPEQLKTYIEEKRNTGVFLSVLGFGQGNYNDELMQKLAQNGNGNAAYIDSVNEARKVLVEEAGSTLFTIAKDVKLQVEFNPNKVAEYRLIGYQTRQLNREDFNNDKVDAGDIGSGHTVTAIYEITSVDSKARQVDDLRYGAAEEKAKPVSKDSGELAFLKIRYKLPDSNTSTLITRPITDKDVAGNITKVSEDIRFAAGVAAFGQLLRGEAQMGDYTFDEVLTLAESARGADNFGYRTEFLNLVRTTKALKPSTGIDNPVEPQPLEFIR